MLKHTLRTDVLAARAALGAEERAAASEQIRRQLLALPELTAARAVLAYAAMETEVDLDPLLGTLLERGTQVLLPRVEGEALVLHRVRRLLVDLRPGWRGVREPDPSRTPVMSPSAVEGVIAPGIAFDPAGRRLGHGGGHFDRLLAILDAAVPRIGVAFACQVVPEVPTEGHDETVDVVVTEAAILRRAW